MSMKSIAKLQKELLEIGEEIADIPRSTGLFLMPDSPTHSGASHAEIVNGQYHYVVTERGSEFERKVAKDEDELLYWFVADSTFSIACAWELEHRKENEDSRLQLFSKQIELLNKINSTWAARKTRYHEQVLKENPFTR
jgi:hypothetical protein